MNIVGPVLNTNTNQSYCTIQAAIDDAATLAGHTIQVAAGTYSEAVDITKPLTLIGTNQGVSCSATRAAESMVDAGLAGTAFTISSSGVSIDGFSIKGAVGISSENHSDLQILNNIVEAEYLGIAVTGVSTSSATSATSAIADNCVQINNRTNPLSEPSAGIAVGNVLGTQAMTISDNEVSGDAFYGNLFFAMNTLATTTISGESVTGATVGLGVVNTLDGAIFFPSTLDIDGFTASAFDGPTGAFQAGIYAFTGGLSSGMDVLTLNVSNVNIDGVNNTATNSAGISLSDFSDQDAASLIVATIDGSTLTNNNPRGLHATGSVEATVSNSEFTGNGADGTGYAFYAAETTTTGNGAAHVTVTNCFINHPASSPGGVTAFVTNHNGTMTATNNSIDFNGNAQARGASTTVGGGNGGPIEATCNWWGTTAGSAIAGGITGDVNFELFLADGGDSGSATPGFSPTGECSGCVSGNTIENTTQSTFYCTLQDAIADANANDVIAMSAGSYEEVGQIIIDKNLTISGADNTTTILKPTADHVSASEGWFRVNSGVTLHLSKVKLDGTGYQIWNGIYFDGNGSIDDVWFEHIQNNPSTAYRGTGVLVTTGAGNVDIQNSTFTNIGRDGIRHRSTGMVSGNTYTGKGAGNWLDYFILAEFGCDITIDGNNVTDNLGVATSDGSNSSAIAIWDDPNTKATVTNNILTDNTYGIAFAVINSTDPTWAWPEANIGDGNVITGGEYGIYASTFGSNAFNPPLTFGATTLKNNSEAAIFFSANAGAGAVYDISSLIFKDAADNTITDNYAIEDLVTHLMDGTDRALLLWQPENLYVTTNTLGIQNAVDIASPAFTVNVQEGTYDENVSVDKSLTLLGANANTPCDSRGLESLIAPAFGAPVTITADGVTLNGFEMTAPNFGFAIEYSNRSDVGILYNNIHDIGNDIGYGGPPTNSNTVHAIRYQLDAGSYSNMDVSNNCISSIGHAGNTFNSTSAIAFLQSTSQGTLTGVNITNNSISNIRAANEDWTLGGRIAYGVLINVGGNSGFADNGKVVNATIEGNTIDDLDGFISTGIGLEGNTENALVQLNVISNLSGAKIGADRSGGGLDLQALKFEKNRYVGTVTVVHNSFATNTYVHDGTPNLGYGVANYVDASLYGSADVTCNWYGTADPFEIDDNDDLDGKILNKAGAQSTFLPFLVNDDINTPDCSGTGPVANLTQGTSHMTVQAGVDAAIAGDVLEIQAADFTEPAQVVVDKSLTLQGLGKTSTTLRPGINTGTSDNARGFIVVNANVDFNLQDLTVDGSGKLVWQALRNLGEGSVSNVKFTEIKYNPSTNYQGTAIAAFGTGNVDVSDCEFDEIGRIGVIYFGGGINGANYSNNTYTGKGPGNWIDYALDISAGAKVNVSGNTISGNRGLASSDGSTSAAVLVSTFFGPGTEATVTNNFISDNTTGVFVGFNSSDASTVTVNNNSITGNENGVISTAQNVDATCNWWGSAVYDDIALLINSNVDFNPALLGGTDDDLVAPGFQPAAACGNTDLVPPVAVCQNITLYLDASGQAQITDPEDLDGGSTDNAGIASFAVSKTNFDCTDLGANNVTLTVTDINGNTDDCTAVVTVEDNIFPIITCASSGTRTINQANLTYEVSGTEFDPTAVDDNCGFTLTHNAADIIGAVSTGDDTTLDGWQFAEGEHTITFTVTDAADNEATCAVTLTVEPIVLSANVSIIAACTPRPVRVQVYPAGGNVNSQVAEYVGNITSSGTFELDMPDVAPGNYDIYVKPEGYLQRKIPNVIVTSAGPSINVTGLKAGDVSSGVAIMGLNGSFNDNLINTLDLTLLIAHYNTISSGSNYNFRANFNCDNFVDALDLSFISFFYFDEGETPDN